MGSASGFDRLASVYQLLEFVAFGRDLERARFALLGGLSSCREILVLGEGDGRCLENLLRLAPQARVDCIDSSAGMLARAESRLAAAERSRTRFMQLDVLGSELPEKRYDAVVTLFFLDCFTIEQLDALVPRIAQRTTLDALWLWADFALPARGFPRLRARCWLAILYAFFACMTSIAARALPPAESTIEAAGFQPVEARVLRTGLLRTVIFRNVRAGP